MRRECVERVGYPREDLIVYADDREYTARICASGGRLVFVPDSVIEDIDLSSCHAYGGGIVGGYMGGVLDYSEPRKAAYLTRNTAFFSVDVGVATGSCMWSISAYSYS